MNTKIRKMNIAILAVLSMLMLLGSCLLMQAKPVRAAESDTVQVTGLDVQWDGNGKNHDLLSFQLKGADYTAVNENILKNWEWFRPYIYVNGTQIAADSVAWGRACDLGRKDRFCFFLKKDILKQDGTDVVEVKKGCKFPKTGGDDFYYVAEDAKFFAGGKPGQSEKHEHFLVDFDWTIGAEMDATDVIVKSQSSEVLDGKTSQSLTVKYRNMWGLTDWAANTATNVQTGEFVRVEFNKPFDTKAIQTLKINYLFNVPNVVFDFYPVEAQELNNSTLAYTAVSTGQGAGRILSLPTAAFADENGLMHGFIVLLNENAQAVSTVNRDKGSQWFLDSLTPLAEAPASFAWEADHEYDADTSVFVPLVAKTIGGCNSKALSIGDLEKHGWGITGFAAFAAGGLEVNNFVRYQFVNPIDAAQFKSMEITFMHNDNNAKFYVYPLGTEEFIAENAVQSFRTPSGAGKKTTLSTEKLAENGFCRGFMIQVVEKNGGAQQFFLDSVTLKTAAHDTDITVTFSDGVAAKKIPFNTAVTAPEAPVKAATAEYTYTFDGWYVGDTAYNFETKLTEDISITAKFTATKNKYNVTFKNEDGSVIGEPVAVEYGATVTAPQEPTKDATAQYTYTFDGWYNGTAKWDVATATVTEDVVLTAKFTETVNKYTVTFDNDVAAQTVEYGSKAKEPTAPAKAADAQYTYTFDGWYNGDAKFDFNTAIKENVSLKAKFTATVNKYTVTFDNGVAAQTVEYGATIKEPTAPTKEATAEYTYTFDGWYNGDTKFDFNTKITSAIELKAKFNATKNTYTVTFKNEDGSVIGEPVVVEYGATVTAPQKPTKDATNEFTFAFDGWYLGEEKFDFSAPVTENIELTVKFIQADKQYTVTFSDGVAQQKVKYNQAVTKPEDPVKDGYEFVGWFNGETEYDFTQPVTKDLTLTAKFEEVKGGCGGAVYGASITLTAVAVLGAAVMVLKKKKIER